MILSLSINLNFHNWRQKVLSKLILILKCFQVPAGGRWGGPPDERDQTEVQVQQPSGQVRQPGPLLHVAAPGAQGRLQEGRLEGVGLCDEDCGGSQCPAPLTLPPQQYSQQVKFYKEKLTFPLKWQQIFPKSDKILPKTPSPSPID